MLVGFYEGGKDVVRQGLVASGAGLEPLQDVVVDADVLMFRRVGHMIAFLILPCSLFTCF